MELTIKHNATLNNLNSRIEKHGDERVTAVDMDLTLNDIPAGELDQFALDGNMLSTTLWENDDSKDLVGGFKLGKPKLPLLNYPVGINMEFPKHKVVIAIESMDDHLEKNRGAVTINDAKVKKIKFTPKNHGLADLTLQVQGALEGHETGKVIARYQGGRVTIVIEPGDESQQMLLDESERNQAASKSGPLSAVANG